MKAAVWSVFAIAVLAAGPVSVSAAAQTAAVKPADSTLDEQIEKKISKDATLKNYKVDVSVDNSIVTITGAVPTDAARRKATQIATMTGVARVDNQLVVDPAAPKNLKATVGTAGEKTKEGAEKVAEKTKDGAVKVGEKTKEGVSKTGEAITDGWITSRVKSKFIGEDLLKDSDINVDTNDHVVTLKGTVLSAAARARAVEQAKEVEGVHRVVDQLTIGPKR
jgi:hyperosmotically inducible periplasmic protein